MRRSQRILIASLAALIAGLLTFVLQANRDLLFENRWHDSVGPFVPTADPRLLQQAIGAAEAEMRGATCVGNWIGKDERYAYVAVGCGAFRAEGAKIQVTGDQNFRPVRFERNGAELKNPEGVDAKNFENSLKRIFPRVAADRLSIRMNAQLFREQGLAKQSGKVPPATPTAPPAPQPSIPAK